METPKPVNYMGWGLLLGAGIGAAVGIMLYVLAGEAVYFAIAAIVGGALGLVLGALYQAHRARERERLAENAEAKEQPGLRR